MAKKVRKAITEKATKVIPNGGYAKACQLTKMKYIQDNSIDTSWMESLPGGSWRDPGVLRAYMKSKLNVK